MNINFFSNGSCKNHGCEAIYVSLKKILGNEKKYYVYSENYIDDINILDDKFKIINMYKHTNTKIDTLLYKVKYKLLKKDRLYFDYKYKPFARELNKQHEIFLSVGGDNYCYGFNDWLRSLNDYVLKKENKILLVGCSIEPRSLDADMIESLKKFSGIIVRESISYSALNNVGLKQIYLKPDPAFVLPTTDIDTNNDSFFSNEIIGINISPLILKKEVSSGILYSNIHKLIFKILNDTTYNILLIPHVTVDGGSDYETLNEIYKEYDNSRVRLLQEENATVLKGYISKCRILITARTHASIAAYSNCIPTLVLGYSVKSRGIAKDIFGREEDYVLPIEQVSEVEDIYNAFMYIEKNYCTIKEHLENVIPKYKNECYEIRDIIEKFR